MGGMLTDGRSTDSEESSPHAGLAFLDRIAFGKEPPDDRTMRLRSRVVVAIILFTLPFWFIYGAFWYLGGAPQGLYLNTASAIASLLLIPLVRAGVRPLWVGRIFALVAMVSIFCLALFVAGFDLPILSWNLVVPIAAVLFRSPKPALIWAMTFVVQIAVLWFLDSGGLLPARHASVSPEFARLADVLNLLGIMTSLMMIAALYNRVHAKQEAERDALRDKLLKNERLAGLGSLAASIGHEINNPLGYAMNNIEFLRSREKSPGLDRETVQALRDAWEGTDRVRRIAARLNAFARNNTDPRPIQVEQAIVAALELASSELQQIGLVEHEIDGELHVEASDELTQVVLNLLVNAAHSIRGSGARAGAGRIQICARADDDDRVIIQVQDNGPGIQAQAMERIFDPFFTTKPPGEGTGLGLSVSLEVVRRFGGTLTAKNQAGAGAIFTIGLPRTRPSSVLEAVRRVPEVRGARILIIDDEPALLRALSRLLRGQELETASGGEAALNILREESFDLILCDVMMPDVSGPTLHQKVKAELGSAIAQRFVFMTGGSFQEAETEYLERCACATLAKPIDRETLLELLVDRGFGVAVANDT